MSDQHPLNDTPATPQAPASRSRRTGLIVAGVALGAALTGAVATTAVSQSFRGGPGHWGHDRMMGMVDGFIEDRADRGVRHLAVEIDATPEQQEKLRTITKAAVKDLLPLREKAQAARQKAHDLLTGANIDRAAIEAFRAEQVAAMDAASKRVAQALGDAAEVLTPAQRAKVGDFHERMGPGGPGGRGGPGGWRGGWHRG